MLDERALLVNVGYSIGDGSSFVIPSSSVGAGSVSPSGDSMVTSPVSGSTWATTRAHFVISRNTVKIIHVGLPDPCPFL